MIRKYFIYMFAFLTTVSLTPSAYAAHFSISPGALQIRVGAPGTITITTGDGGKGGTYTATTGTAAGTNVNISNLLTNGSLTNGFGQTISFPAKNVTISAGEVQIDSNVIKSITSPNGLIIADANGGQGGVIGLLALGGALTGLDVNGNAASYVFNLGYGDTTGNPTYFAQSTLSLADITNATNRGLLTATYNNLESQLIPSLQDALTLDLADNTLSFMFPSTIQDPTVEGYTTDAGLTYTSGLTLPEPASLALISLGFVGMTLLRRSLTR